MKWLFISLCLFSVAISYALYLKDSRPEKVLNALKMSNSQEAKKLEAGLNQVIIAKNQSFQKSPDEENKEIPTGPEAVNFEYNIVEPEDLSETLGDDLEVNTAYTEITEEPAELKLDEHVEDGNNEYEYDERRQDEQ